MYDSVDQWDILFENDFDETLQYDQLLLGANLLEAAKSACRLKNTCHFFTHWLECVPVRQQHYRNKVEALNLFGNNALSDSIKAYTHDLRDDQHLRDATNAALRLKMTTRFFIKAKLFLFSIYIYIYI